MMIYPYIYPGFFKDFSQKKVNKFETPMSKPQENRKEPSDQE